MARSQTKARFTDPMLLLRTDRTAPVLKNPFVRNQYGFVLGGPVQIPKVFNGKNRLFFAANYESLRDRKGLRQIADVPSVAMRNGNFSQIAPVLYDPATRMRNAANAVVATPFAGNIIPSSRFNGKAITMLKYYLPPNVPTTALSRNYQAIEPRRSDADQFNI